ncbi:MAG TPA: aldehyde dehydrogenase family protein [Candidatus Acidoferrum sp.]|nr:aldehyde dehydrogenase family protein [Candidatus Acidoferrum sp.]
MNANPQMSAAAVESAQDFHLLIGGQLVAGARSLAVINPATGKVFATAPCADAAQLDQAVAAAKAAYKQWSRTSWEHRRGLLQKLADALAAAIPDFARLLTREQGKPLPQAMGELYGSVAILKGLAELSAPEQVLRDDANARIVRQFSPLGVVAAITPWNFPLILLMTKVAPALLAGNTLIIKPAPTTPLTTLRFGELCAQILPAGVVNVITDQNDLGDLLTRHPDIAKVAFTGSSATGRKVMASAAGTLKRLTLELGGNDAAIVLPGTDPAEVAPKLFDGAMTNCGQVCLAIKRIYVHADQYDAVCNELAKLADAAIVGNGLDQGTQIGPLQNRMQYEKVKELIADSATRGKVIAGGKTFAGDGYFIAPTIVRDIADDARLVREEQFGPVVPVLKYTDLDDAIARANSTDYGLGGTVWGDPARAFAVASRFESGTVWINKHLDLPPDVPFGGAKGSGFGVEMGDDGLQEFMQARVINSQH